GLLPLLAAGQTQVDEGGLSAADVHSLQRCPNGSGGGRHTIAYRPAAPTPGSANDCTADQPPEITSVSPSHGAIGVAPDDILRIVTTEDVIVENGWFEISCEFSGDHSAQA